MSDYSNLLSTDKKCGHYGLLSISVQAYTIQTRLCFRGVAPLSGLIIPGAHRITSSVFLISRFIFLFILFPVSVSVPLPVPPAVRYPLEQFANVALFTFNLPAKQSHFDTSLFFVNIYYDIICCGGPSGPAYIARALLITVYRFIYFDFWGTHCAFQLMDVLLPSSCPRK